MITNKILKNIGIIFKVGQFLTKETTKTLYYTLVHPNNYCNVIWANNYPTRLSRIVILHKRTVRAMAMFPFSSPEAALLVSTKKRDLWPGPIPEVRDSRTSRHSAHAQSQVWQIWWVLVSIYFVYQAIQNWNIVRPCQRLRFLVLIKRSVASGDENAGYRFQRFG